MVGWLRVAALGATFIALPAFGQRGGHGGSAGHAGFASHGAVGGMHGTISARGGFAGRPSASARWAGGVHGGFRGGFRGRPFRGRCFGCSHHRFPRYYGYGWYPGWGWGWYDDVGYNDSYSEPDYQAYDYRPNYSAQDQQTERLRDEVDRLSDEVAQLREEREQASKPLAKKESETAELIFRDKHTQEVRNYAIVGQTVWLLDSKTAKKISLSELDIPATIKVNQERGVDFGLPR